MKLWKCIVDQMVRYIMSISDEQFGLRPRVGNTDPIFVIRTQCKMHRQSNMVFADLEKAHATVPREVLSRCTRKRNIPEAYVAIMQDML